MCVYHNFCIHSSVEGQLRLFPYLGYWNSAAVNIEVHISLQNPFFHFLWIYIQKSNCWIINGSSIFNFFEEPPYFFPIVATPVYIPTNSYTRVSLSSRPHQHLSRLLNDSHSNRYEVVSHCGLIWFSLMISDVEHVFMTCWPYICLLWKNVYFLCLFFNWVIWGFVIEL